MNSSRKAAFGSHRAASQKIVTAVTETLVKERSEYCRKCRELHKMTVCKFERVESMRTCFGILFCVALLAWAEPALAERAYTPEATVVRYVSTHDVRADGSDRQTTEFVLRVETPQGISDLGAQRIGYRGSIDEVESIEASTIKPDGTEIKIPANAIRTQDEDSDGGATEFSDSKYKVIVFPAVEVGSQVRYKVTMNHRTTTFPKLFEDSYIWSPEWKWESSEIIINVPVSLALYVQQRGISGGLKNMKAGVNHYQFSFSNTGAKAPESGSVSAVDYAPILYVSTYQDMIAIGRAYQVASRPMAALTDNIRNVAKEVTKGSSNDADKVRALDHWMAKNIRYVAVTLGHGGLIPHPAQEVLKNRYGDCKDHAILMEALLAAVGIESSGALVNSGNAYTLATVGSIGPPNHIITYIPSLDLYVDSTNPFAHVGTLSFGVMDKPTVLTALGHLGRTPPMRADQNVVRTEIEMKIQPDGAIEGHASSSITGVLESESRANRFYAQSSTEAEVVKKMLYRFNETGSGSLDSPDPTVLDQSFWVKSSFKLDPVTNFPGPGALMTPVGLAPGGIAALGTNKPVEQREWQYTCVSRTLEDSYLIEFPSTAILSELPDGVNYRQAGIDYQSTYTKTGHSVAVHRILEVQRTTDTCTPQDNEEWKEFHTVLQRDLRSQVFYR
jgi:transglutaminase-like putative cysteine protease